MALKDTQQILETLKRSEHPLICLPSGAHTDHYATAIGLARVLSKMDKQPTIVAADGTPPPSLRFLPGHDQVQSSLQHLRQFVIELDAGKTSVDELRYELKDDKLKVYLSPKKGFWESTDVRTSSSAYKYDLIICIGAPDHEACAHLFTENPEFFFHTPLINIDHAPENEHYGQLNAVDLTASACGEVCYDLIESIEPTLIDEETATAFLTGIIAKTRSFKSKHLSPKTLQTAGKLMARGAKREHIIQHLYRTRSVATLRLWGRALARLKTDETRHMAWTLLSAQDFLHSGAQEQDLPDIIDELLSSSPHARVTVLLFETAAHTIRAIVRTERPVDALVLCAPFHATGTHEEVRMEFPDHHLIQAETRLIDHLKTQLT